MAARKVWRRKTFLESWWNEVQEDVKKRVP
jgi:hypothetical protein